MVSVCRFLGLRDTLVSRLGCQKTEKKKKKKKKKDKKIKIEKKGI